MAWQFGGEWGRDFFQNEADVILDRAHEEGINLIDTAECYGNHLSESFIGDYLSRRNRTDWVLATKFGHAFSGHLEREQLWKPNDVLRQLEDSLRALKTDYIDLYQFHSGTDEVFDQDDLWTMLDKQVQSGKIRHLGTSIGSNDNLHQTEASSHIGSKAIQVVYNRLDRKPEERVFPVCLEQNLGVLARVPMASGYLSGKYKPGAVFPANDVRNRHNSDDTRKKLETVAEILQTEVPTGIDMATWALAWCLQHPAVTTVIPGCKNPEQVSQNARAAELVSPDHPQAL